MKRLSEKEVKRKLLEILLWVDKLCKEINVKYFLYYGTLLGAVRHKGFIPWDDDIDICMLRSDYNRFITMFPSNDSYELQSIDSNKRHCMPYAKIRNVKTVKISCNTGLPYENDIGLDIDLFIIDGFSNIRLIRSIHFNVQKFLFISLYERLIYYSELKPKNRKEVIKKWIISSLNVRIVARLVNIIAAIWKSEKVIYSGCMVALYRRDLELALSESYDDFIEADFENCKFPIPIGYDDVLKSIYGVNYMVPPPLNERRSSHECLVFYK